MKIGIIGSMQYTEKMIEARDELLKLNSAGISWLYNTAVLVDSHRDLSWAATRQGSRDCLMFHA